MLKFFAKNSKYLSLVAGMALCISMSACVSTVSPPPHGLIIHGGAGSGGRADISPQLEQDMRQAMNAALEAGYQRLDSGATSLDAVTAAITVLENSPAFNAGIGAVFNASGGHELDASIMDGRTLNAGAVAGVTVIKNPILLARAVMDKSRHVMMSGPGAEAFAQTVGLETVEQTYFDTDRRLQQLEKALERTAQTIGDQPSVRRPINEYFGTVGVVALDKNGNLAAGTSTGGMTAKRFGRVGDSPIIGAGTYANDESCGVSSTGHGEYFIRHVVAYSICARMQFKGLSVHDAADQVVMKELVEAGGSGGVVAMDARGNIAWPFNSNSMVRAHQSRDSAARVLIFKDE